MSEVDERERQRVARHEAAHAAMAFLLRRRIDVASIRPCPGWAGAVFHAPLRLREQDRTTLVCERPPVVQLPARLRRQVETSILIALAGPLQDELHAYEAGRAAYRK